MTMIHQFAFVVLISLSVQNDIVAQVAQSNLRAGKANYAVAHQRRLSMSDWWYSFLNAIHAPCPHGSTNSHPLGHCAHHSHPHSSHHSSDHSGGSEGGGDHDKGDDDDDSSGGSSGCNDDAGRCDDSWGDDGHDDNSWGDDGHDEAWADDGHEAVEWHDDGHTNEAEAWADDGYSTTQLDLTSSGNSSYGTQKESSGKAWGIGALFAAMFGACAFVSFRKRKQSDRDDETVPKDVYVEADGDEQPPMSDVVVDRNKEPSVLEMQSVKSNLSRRGSIRSSLMNTGASLRSKMSRSGSSSKKDVSTAGSYKAPNSS